MQAKWDGPLFLRNEKELGESGFLLAINEEGLKEHFQPSPEQPLCKSSVMSDNADKGGVHHGGQTQTGLCGDGP
jgi:hypothetical protein